MTRFSNFYEGNLCLYCDKKSERIHGVLKCTSPECHDNEIEFYQIRKEISLKLETLEEEKKEILKSWRYLDEEFNKIVDRLHKEKCDIIYGLYVKKQKND
jgi:hypothetical protein